MEKIKGPGKGHGKSWSFKMLKGYEPCFQVLCQNPKWLSEPINYKNVWYIAFIQ